MKIGVIYIFLMLLCFSFNESVYSQNQNKGVLQVAAYYPQENDTSTKAGTIRNPLKNMYWFRDSCVIYEMRINLESSEQTPEGTITKSSYPVGAYIYLDLRTMLCQDYFYFKDTATPVCSFFLKPGESTGWSFYRQNNIESNKEGFITIPDTTIGNSIFKRVKKVFNNPSRDYYELYYLNCNDQQNIFNINRTLSEIYPNCKTTRGDLVDTATGKIICGSEYKILRDTLNENEENIFKQWGENAKNNKLPIVPFQTAQKSFFIHNEHENPSIKVVDGRSESD